MATTRPQSFQFTERTPILNNLADILNLRGRLQQMGANFNSSGELLTYGNPESPSEFKSMLKFGPLYEEQWNMFFDADYVPVAEGDMWSKYRTLKKKLNNKDIVLGKAGQRYSVGGSSDKLKQLCFAYDTLWVEWRNAMRKELPAQQVHRGLAIIKEESSQGHDSGFVDDIAPGGLVITAPSDIIQRQRRPLSQDNDMTHNIDWWFSTELSQSPPQDQSRLSNDLASVSVRNDVERTTQTVPIASNAQTSTGELIVPHHDSLQEIETYLANIGASMNHRAQSPLLLDLQDALSLGPQTGDAQVITGAESSSTSTSSMADEQKNRHDKKNGKLRRWFQNALNRS
ncbi:hypothetical protein A1F94_004502 [Pyrenophora tritici-repentis]|nr:hypothetical protein PtrV1_07082 [Pyrenophora tritici-repentis]KAF7448140.1 hypothetical protein A1F99_075040 [Pyrenophora tritici-repentis]KAG9384955.1 hypothetical protein A1F94_004502 [Pyrenophora tritici-repentis]KAI0569448.1 hypothetical protein Alg215_11632 [Pyrenophora tritici-repentis]KAI0569823.1 hypothetical protein Alg130_11480 [Pyrenophora tritici-repentis]